jgi:hypothetical protein
VERREYRSCCSKKRFADENAAEKRGRPYAQRAYMCDFCGGFHLTSKELRWTHKVRNADPNAPWVRLERAQRALRELERKNITGPLYDTACVTVSELLLTVDDEI